MKCFICGNNSAFLRLKPELCQTNNYLCQQCGLVFIPRSKKYLHSYYKKGGYFNKSPNLSLRKFFVSKNLFLNETNKFIKRLIHDYLISFTNKSVLDIGCAYGNTLSYLKKRYKCHVVGLEPSKETAALGKQLFNVNIKPLLFEEFVTKDKFDFIFCSSVLEHVDDPITFLNKISRLLKKNGILYLLIPNILKPTGGFDLNTFLYDEHLQTFTLYSLYLLLKQCELKIIKYKDDNLLEIISVLKSDKRRQLLIHPIPGQKIIDFLKRYKSGYNLFNYMTVYKYKFIYLLKIIYYKIIDAFEPVKKSIYL